MLDATFWGCNLSTKMIGDDLHKHTQKKRTHYTLYTKHMALAQRGTTCSCRARRVRLSATISAALAAVRWESELGQTAALGTVVASTNSAVLTQLFFDF